MMGPMEMILAPHRHFKMAYPKRQLKGLFIVFVAAMHKRK